MGLQCRHCGERAGSVTLDLGRQPSAEAFPRGGSGVGDPLWPLRMWLCAGCGLAQLVEDADSVEGHAPAVVEPRAMSEQLSATLEFAAEHGIGRGARVAVHGSPHGAPLAPRLRDRGLVPVAQAPVDVVLDIYGLLHEPDQAAALDVRLREAADGGAVLLQMHPLAAVLAETAFTELRHGHFAYWSLSALDGALRSRGWGVHRVRWFPYDGGTLAVLATAAPDPDDEVRALLAADEAAGVTDPGAVGLLQEAADRQARTLKSWLAAERAAGRRVLGYGAASRAVPLLCHAGIDAGLLPAVADAAPAKHGRRMPGTDIPIVPVSELVRRLPDRVLVLVPGLLAEVRAGVPEVEEYGGRWVSWPLDPAAR